MAVHYQLYMICLNGHISSCIIILVISHFESVQHRAFCYLPCCKQRKTKTVCMFFYSIGIGDCLGFMLYTAHQYLWQAKRGWDTWEIKSGSELFSILYDFMHNYEGV